MPTIYYTGPFRFPIYDAAAARVLQNVKIFIECGYKVKVISWGGKNREEDLRSDGKYSYLDIDYIVTNDIDIKSQNVFMRLCNYILNGEKAYCYLENKLQKNDIIVMYNPSYSFTRRMIQLCKRRNANLISDITEWYDSKEIVGGKLLPFYWFYEWNMKYLQRKIEKKIVISLYLRNYYKNESTIVLPPLVDLSDNKWSIDKRVLPIYSGKRLIYAGSTNKSKDLLLTMINSVINCVDCGMELQLIILGVSDKDKLLFISPYVAHTYSDNIVFLGRISQISVPLYYNACDFSLFIREKNRKNMAGFPTKFVESMAAGCPVITNKTSDISKYLKNGVNGFVVEDFTEGELVKVLFQLNSINKEDIDQMKRNAYESANEYFNYLQYKSQMIDFLNNI